LSTATGRAAAAPTADGLGRGRPDRRRAGPRSLRPPTGCALPPRPQTGSAAAAPEIQDPRRS